MCSRYVASVLLFPQHEQGTTLEDDQRRQCQPIRRHGDKYSDVLSCTTSLLMLYILSLGPENMLLAILTCGEACFVGRVEILWRDSVLGHQFLIHIRIE